MEVTTSSYEGENLVFLVGCPRSGTTWLQRLLASHPKIHTGQESHLFEDFIGPQLKAWRWQTHENPGIKTARGGVGMGCYFDEATFIEELRTFVRRLLRSMMKEVRTGELFLEKTPAHALFISEIRTVLPRSRFIHLLRDPRDVVASLLAVSQSWGSHWAPSSPGTAAQTWRRYIQATEEAAKRLPAEAFMEVTYEDLSASPQTVLKNIGGFLGLTWSEIDIEQAIKKNSPEAIRAGSSTPIPVFGHHARGDKSFVQEPRSFVRKAIAGSGKKELSLLQKTWVWHKLHDLMEEKGYQWTWTDWMPNGKK